MKKIVLFGLVVLILNFAQVTFAEPLLDTESIARDMKSVTVRGTAENGEIIGYSLALKEADANLIANLYAFGDVKSDINGEFCIKFEFPESADTGKYTLYYGSLNSVRKSFDIDYVNYFKTMSNIKNANSSTMLNDILLSDEHMDELEYVGFNVKLFKELKYPENVSKSLFENYNLKACNDDEILKAFNISLGIECINEKIQGGIDFINPVFEDVEFQKISDTLLKEYLVNGIYRLSFETINDFNDAYALYNVLYKVELSSVGGFSDLIIKYNSELKLNGESIYSKFIENPEKHIYIAEEYFEEVEKKPVLNLEDFIKAFSTAVNNVTKPYSDNSGSSGSSGSSGLGGGGVSLGVKDFATIVTPAGTTSETKVIKFNDIDHVAWAKDAIFGLAEKGIVNGFADGIFAPDEYVKREELVKMVVLCLNEKPSMSKHPFADVKSDVWYAPYVSKAYEMNLIQGISDTEFGVGNEISRQDLAVVILRASEENDNIDYIFDGETQFLDNQDISDYAKEAVGVLYNRGIINGNGNNYFKPKAKCTRAEAAKIIWNVFFGG